jgi:hypothetical protein
MLSKLRQVGSGEAIYIFSKFYKPINISMPTVFGALANFSSWDVFSEEKIQGFKAIMNEYSDLITGYVRIGDSVYKAEDTHEYKTLPQREGRELIKALVSRAARINKFDLSMMDSSWVETFHDADASQLDLPFNESDDDGLGAFGF